MVERLGEMRKERRDMIEKGSKEDREKRKRQREGPRASPFLEF